MTSAPFFALTGEAHHVRRDMAAQVARLYAQKAAREADPELDSIEGWVLDEMREGAGREAQALAVETGLPLTETRSLIGGALRRYYTARRMAALPPAMRWHAIRCQDPTVPVLLGLMEGMDPEDRGGMDALRATRRLYVVTQAQGRIQRDRASLATPQARHRP